MTPELEEAIHWIKTNCRHWAIAGTIPGSDDPLDWQTLDNILPQEMPIALSHLQTIREAGLLYEGYHRHGNFIVRRYEPFTCFY